MRTRNHVDFAQNHAPARGRSVQIFHKFGLKLVRIMFRVKVALINLKLITVMASNGFMMVSWEM